MDGPTIAPKTVEKLLTPPVQGTRHTEAISIALSMLGDGNNSQAVYRSLYEKYYPGLTEPELQGIVTWASTRKDLAPSGFNSAKSQQYFGPVYHKPAPVKPRSPAEHAGWWLRGTQMTPENFRMRSQLQIPNDHTEALCLALENLWLGTEHLNIVGKFFLDKDGKAKPQGSGRTLSRDQWLEYIRQHGIPKSQSGCWMRPNPCKPQGTGKEGAITDSDVVKYRFMLLESDVLPLSTQMALFAKLKLPIAAVISSGGHSIHAWVRVDAKDAEDYETQCRRILTVLAPFGIDQSNKNPSRLSRLPGAIRKIGAENGGEQTLLWLNPGVKPLVNGDMEAFENSLLIPAIEEKPFHKIVEDSIPRFEYLEAHKGNLGVKTGLPTLDRYMGGWKPNTMNVIAAETGRCKTTLAMNLMNRALRDNVGVALFTMEMTSEDICDMLFSMNAKIDRNKFNTGDFEPDDHPRIIEAAAWMKELPLWIDDAASITTEQIRKTVLALKAENRIGLVIVDYAQLVRPANERDSRELQVANIARDLRILSKDSALPFIVLSQLNDEGRIRESRVLAHEASNVFVLQTKSGAMNDPELVLRTAKGRKIPSNTLDLYFDAKYCLIAEKAKIDPDNMPAVTKGAPSE